MASNTIVRVPNSTILDIPGPSEIGIPSAYVRPQAPANEGLPWRQFMRILRKHWRLSLGFFIAVEAGLALFLFSLDNVYESHARIEVEAPAGENVSINSGAAPPAIQQQEYLDTQTQILKGDWLALGVINELHLDQNPAFLKQSWIQKLPNKILSLVIPSRGDGQTQTEKLLEIYKGQFSVEQVRNSRLVDVSYESYDPQLASQIVSTALRQYLEMTHRSKYEATLRAAESMAPELNELKSAAEKASRALLEFQRSHEGVEFGTTTAPGPNGTQTTISGNPLSVRVAELNQQLTAAMADRLQQESYLHLLENGNNDALPQMKDDPVIQGIATRIADSRAQLAQALAVYGENNPQVKKLQMQVEELNSQMQVERGRIAAHVRSAYNSAVRREELIQKTLRELKGPLDASNANIAQYDALKREADATSNLYTELSSRIKELGVSGSLNANNIRVVDQARVPELPSGPHRIRMLLAGLLFGIVGGVGLAFVSEGMDDTISSLDDLRTWSSIPALALVPEFSRTPRTRSLPAPNGSAAALQSVITIKNKGIPVFIERPRSPEAESIRNLGTAIRLSGLSDRRVQTVLITSAFPGEGKTTLAVNLAVALARYGKTCLVDADFRHPAITSSFGLSLKPGLQDLLVRARGLREVCTPLPESPSLTVIGTGMRHPDALEILTSQRMRDLVEELRAAYEYVVLDSPPIIPFADARWLSTLSDGAVIVARTSATTRRALMWSIELLEEVHAPVLGVVLNGVNLQSEYYAYGVESSPAKSAKTSNP